MRNQQFSVGLLVSAAALLSATGCDQEGAATRSAELEGDPTTGLTGLTGPPPDAEMGGSGWVWVDVDGLEVPGIGAFGDDHIYYEPSTDSVWFFDPMVKNPTAAFWGEATIVHGVSASTNPCDDTQYGWVDAPFVNMVAQSADDRFSVVKPGATLTFQQVMYTPRNGNPDNCEPLGNGWAGPLDDFLSDIDMPTMYWRPPVFLEYRE